MCLFLPGAYRRSSWRRRSFCPLGLRINFIDWCCCSETKRWSCSHHRRINPGGCPGRWFWDVTRYFSLIPGGPKKTSYAQRPEYHLRVLGSTPCRCHLEKCTGRRTQTSYDITKTSRPMKESKVLCKCVAAKRGRECTCTASSLWAGNKGPTSCIAGTPKTPQYIISASR